MKPQMPGLGPIAALMLTAVLAAWLGVSGPINLAHLQQWQTLIGAGIAAGGVAVTAYIAVRNVGKQLALNRTSMWINLISREEDRIEEALPGLRQLELLAIEYSNLVAGALNEFDKFQVPQDTRFSQEWVEKIIKERLPDADVKDRNDLFFTMSIVVGAVLDAQLYAIRWHEAAGRPINYYSANEINRDETIMAAAELLKQGTETVRRYREILDRQLMNYHRRIVDMQDQAISYRREIRANLAKPQ